MEKNYRLQKLKKNGISISKVQVSIFLLLSMLLFLPAHFANAQGTGTASDPFQISTPQQ